MSAEKDTWQYAHTNTSEYLLQDLLQIRFQGM
jgi:hypothetical protein